MVELLTFLFQESLNSKNETYKFYLEYIFLFFLKLHYLRLGLCYQTINAPYTCNSCEIYKIINQYKLYKKIKRRNKTYII